MYARRTYRELADVRRDRAAVVDDESFSDNIDGGHDFGPRVVPFQRPTGKPISKVAVKPFIVEFES